MPGGEEQVRCPPQTLATILAICAILAGAPAETVEGALASAESVGAFVCRHYIHGIAYADANSLGKEALPSLRAILADSSKKSCWENAIVVIAAIGSPESYGLLRAFLWDRFQGAVDEPTYAALQAAVATMGFASPGQPALVVDFLEKGADPRHWKLLPWYYPPVRRARTEHAFSRFSIHGLGFCAQPRAQSILIRLLAKPYETEQRAVIRASIRTQQQVAARGLLAYEKSKGTR